MLFSRNPIKSKKQFDLKQLDFVFGTEKTESIKGQTREREGRGIGFRLSVSKETPK